MAIPVIDLFAGPGGLGEGFSALRDPQGEPAFRIALSIEMDSAAHQTLELRSFFRQFLPSEVPEDYYRFLRQEISREELLLQYPAEAQSARHEAWKAELGKESSKIVDARIGKAVAGAHTWILCGGPPCQAYSVIGRSRSGGIDEKDHRLYLYREYLRILAVHQPSAFVFENVKGILSSKIKGDGLFQQLLADLSNPTGPFGGSGANVRYRIYPLTQPGPAQSREGKSPVDYRDFVIRSEENGIPQSRHRVILLGVREDLIPEVVPTLTKGRGQVPVARVLRGLPRLRSGLTRRKDDRQEWLRALYEVFEENALKDIPNGKATRILKEIKRTLLRISYPRADRGGIFVRSDTITCDYRSDWFCDPRIGGICNHESRPHMTADLHRYLFTTCYARLFRRSAELRDFPNGLLPKHRNVYDAGKKEYFDDRFRVQIASKPSTTVTSHMAKDGHYFIHYDQTQCRALTVREAARLQTFPDNYYFCGTRTQQYVQVGNAVPPLLAYQIAAVVANTFSESKSTEDALTPKSFVSVAC